MMVYSVDWVSDNRDWGEKKTTLETRRLEYPCCVVSKLLRLLLDQICSVIDVIIADLRATVKL